MTRMFLHATALLALTSAASAQTQATLAIVSSGGELLQVRGLSADGSTVVGLIGTSQGFRAFRWRPQSGGDIESLGAFPDGGFASSQAFAASASGSLITGTSLSEDSLSEDGSPFGWTESGGLFPLGTLSAAGSGGAGYAISRNGSTIVGTSLSDSPTGTRMQAFTWSQVSGMRALAARPNEMFSRANAVSADGRIVVGNSSINVTTNSIACKWVDGVVSLLPQLNPGTNTSAFALTPDGRVAVGGSNHQTMRWDEHGVIALPLLAEGTPNSLSYAEAVTDDGNTIVGLANYNFDVLHGTAFIWDAAHGTRDLNTVAREDYGLDLGDLQLFDARGISADGRVIAGSGVLPGAGAVAWTITLPPPTRCGSQDYDNDGDTGTDRDIEAFFACLSGNCCQTCPTNADFDGDGDVGTDRDIEAFFRVLAGGSC